MKFIDLQRLSLDEMTTTVSSESGTAEPNTAAAAASPLSPPPAAARELGALAPVLKTMSVTHKPAFNDIAENDAEANAESRDNAIAEIGAETKTGCGDKGGDRIDVVTSSALFDMQALLDADGAEYAATMIQSIARSRNAKRASSKRASLSSRRLSRRRKDSEAAVHAALPEIISVGVAAAKNPKAINPIEASWDIELLSQHEFVRLMERPWYVRRASCAASPRRSAPSQRRREYPHRIVASSNRRGDRVAVAKEVLVTTRSRSTARAAAYTRGSTTFSVVWSTRVLAPRFHSNDRSSRHRHSIVVARGGCLPPICVAIMVGGCGDGGLRWRSWLWWLVVVAVVMVGGCRGGCRRGSCSRRSTRRSCVGTSSC